jgi:hypothetical protein
MCPENTYRSRRSVTRNLEPTVEIDFIIRRCPLSSTDESQIDRFSFVMGMINCFAEMVACRVKKLAISPPLDPSEFDAVYRCSQKIVEGFNIECYVEKSLLVTSLQSAEFTAGKWSILYYADPTVLDAYHALKNKKTHLEETNRYTKKEAEHISRSFMTLLSYPEKTISEKISGLSADPFLLIDI